MFTVKDWNGESLDGNYLVTRKVDGIQGNLRSQGIFSRNSKKLYHLPDILGNEWEIAEIFCGSWGETWSIVSASRSERRLVRHDEIYPLFPVLDKRLVIGIAQSPLKETIMRFMDMAIKEGHEGIVLHRLLPGSSNTISGEAIKVKPFITVDAVITGLRKSHAPSHKGLLKEFETTMGRVGTGLTREQRKKYLDPRLIGTYVEVQCKAITENGKWREPVFVRLRPDK